MRTIEDQFDLRDRLQDVEDDLIDAGKRHVTIQGSEGIFEWAIRGAADEPADNVTIVLIEDIEDVIVARGWGDIRVALESGSMSWAPQP